MANEAEERAQAEFYSKLGAELGDRYLEDPFVDDTGWHLPTGVDDDDKPIDDSYEAP